MKQEEVIAGGNKLIADFMKLPVFYGGHRHPNLLFTDHGTDDFDCLDVVAYHSSWDWLMPVCYKFDNLEITEDREGYGRWCDAIDGATTLYEIDLLFPIVVQAIQWYNSLSSPQTKTEEVL